MPSLFKLISSLSSLLLPNDYRSEDKNKKKSNWKSTQKDYSKGSRNQCYHNNKIVDITTIIVPGTG